MRRRRVVLLALMCLFAVIAAVGGSLWLWWVPRYRPGLAVGERYGVDVSAHQGRIGWDAVARDHIRFAYIKETEGITFDDPSFVANWSGAGAAHINRGEYHFFTFCSTGEAQAGSFLAHLPADAELPPAVDLELGGNCAGRPSPAAVALEVDRFRLAVERATGKSLVLYVGDSFEERYAAVRGLSEPRWVRHLFRRPGGTWQIWQASHRAHVDGISGGVDLDVMR